MQRNDRREKSYIRRDYSTDTVYTFFRYKQVSMNFAKKPGTTTRLTDEAAQKMLDWGLIDQNQLSEYTQRVCQEYYHKDCHPEQAPEDIYDFICRCRLETFGEGAILGYRELAFREQWKFRNLAIDQSNIRDRLLAQTKDPVFVLTQPELLEIMVADMKKVRGIPQVLVADQVLGDLLTHQELEDRIPIPVTYITWGADPVSESCLFFYGEEGLLHCRSLKVDAVVTAIPNGYHAQALCNLLGEQSPCVVYIPRGLDITPYVPLTSHTQLSFYHLARLSRDFGEGIYDLSCRALYEKFPRYFLSVYDRSEKLLPLQLEGDFLAFEENREKAIAEYLNGFSNIRYRNAYFGEEKVLVHSIRVTRAKNAQVMSCPKGVTPRQMLAKLPGTALCSNFLFFLTPKLGALYNDLRRDRPREQADAAAGHLDYMLEYQSGKRVETFPLFCKTCIAMTNDGEFLFFPFRLGEGTVTLGNQQFTWDREAVDPEDPGKIAVYTPYFCNRDEDADRETYRKTVGQGRVNVVILGEKIACIRKGDVILPSVGVVLSVSEEVGTALLQRLTPLEDGYYDPSDLSLRVNLAPPEGVDPERWAQLRWAYGGGMSLILDGESLCDGDMAAWFRRDGWMNPLSRQTQESALHKLAKHPRTAIGTAENGDLVILVYSGRTERSSGADYREMIRIARQFYPDIKNLMNVDGGGSAVLAMACDGSFLELSIPATSTGSTVGMVRPIHTVFYIPTEKENEL